MPRLVEMGTLVARCKRRADLENDDHIDPEEWLELVSEAYGELFSIVAGTGLRYFETAATLVTDGAAYVDEPTNHMSTMGLWYVPTSGSRRRLTPIMSQELERWSGRTGSSAERYELIDSRINLYPTPPSGQSYEMRYIPQAPEISGYASDACVDVVVAEGLSFMLWAVAVKAKAKKEKDAQLAIIERDRMADKVLEWAVNRAMVDPQRKIVDDVDNTPVSPASWRYR